MNPKTMRFCSVIGLPIDHSLSPKLFNSLAEILNINLFYTAIEVGKTDLAFFINQIFKKLPFTGINITLPLKEEIIPFLDELSPLAQQTRSVNCVIKENEKLIGHNTDCEGIRKTLEENNICVKDKNIFIFGAGGAARAAAYILGQQGAKTVYFCNQNLSRNNKLRKDLSPLFPHTTFLPPMSPPQEIFMYINASPCGMKGFPQDSLIPPESTAQVAFDLVYSTNQTPFLRAASQKKMLTLDGLDMLIWQGIASLELFFDPIKNSVRIKNSLKLKLKS